MKKLIANRATPRLTLATLIACAFFAGNAFSAGSHPQWLQHKLFVMCTYGSPPEDGKESEPSGGGTKEYRDPQTFLVPYSGARTLRVGVNNGCVISVGYAAPWKK